MPKSKKTIAAMLIGALVSGCASSCDGRNDPQDQPTPAAAGNGNAQPQSTRTRTNLGPPQKTARYKDIAAANGTIDP